MIKISTFVQPFLQSIGVMALCILASCGGKLDNPFTSGIVINGGAKLSVDFSDANQFQFGDNFKVNLKTITPDFSSSTDLWNLTDIIKGFPASTQNYSIVVRKDVSATRPILVTLEASDVGANFVDVLFDGDNDSKPGLVSTLAYELIKNYPNKKINEYTSAEFKTIKALVQARVDELFIQSEYLSPATTPYRKLTRFLKNGLMYNIAFLDAVKSTGVDYLYTVSTPSGLACQVTPEGCSTPVGQNLDHYKYATDHQVQLSDGTIFNSFPFSQQNLLPQLNTSITEPFPGANISVSEGRQATVLAQVFDLDNDFIDKSMIIQYIPRKLPASATLIIPEPTPEYYENAYLTEADGIDSYTAPLVLPNEALDTNAYSSCAPGSGDGTCDTGYRNVYYLYTDGAVLIPERWNFRYVDWNRPPQFLTHPGSGALTGRDLINDSSLDSQLAHYSGDTIHKSYCESDTSNPTEAITSRNDNPWSCVFKTFDPDLDDDPNVAPDEFYYTVSGLDQYTELYIGKPSELSVAPSVPGFLMKMTNTAGFGTGQKAWPVYAPETEARIVKGEMLTSGCGIHRKCGVGIFQITVDNGVKVAAETKASLTSDYTIIATDRQTSGIPTQASVSRTVDFVPIPARLISYDQSVAPAGLPDVVQSSAADIAPSPVPVAGGTPTYTYVHTRNELYLNEVISAALATSVSDASQADKIGFLEQTNSAGVPFPRTAFQVSDLDGVSLPHSKFFTQPRKVLATAAPAIGSPIPTPKPELMDPSLIPSSSPSALAFDKPYEYDTTCSLVTNNSTQPAGWTFELNAVDLDNVGLKPNEPSDPVFIKQLHKDTSKAGVLTYCNYTAPSRDPYYYDTYPNSAVIDACTWSESPPVQMQPVPVYYDVAGVTKKMVYHRLRVRWKPKDERLTYPNPGVIENALEDLLLWGNRTTEDRDRNKLDSALNIYALRKNMAPCAGVDGFGVAQSYLSESQYISNASGRAISISVKDENKRGGYNLGGNTPIDPIMIHGRQQAEGKLVGTRSITSTSFLKFVPFYSDFNSINPKPLIWYTHKDDATNTPRVLLTSAIDSNSMVMGYKYASLTHVESTSSIKQYRSVVLIKNKNHVNLNNVILNQGGQTCFQEDSISIFSDQDTLAIASSCDYTNAQITNPAANPLWDDGNTRATVAVNLNPSDYGFSSADLSKFPYPYISFAWFPEFYQAQYQNPSSTASYDAFNAFFLNFVGFDTFRSDTDPTHPYGGKAYNLYAATGTTPSGPGIVYDSTRSLNIKIDPAAVPGDGTEMGYISPLVNANIVTSSATDYQAFGEVLDWDQKPNALALYTPTPTPTPTNVFYRTFGTVTQVFVKNDMSGSIPTAIIPVISTDSITEYNRDPFDVFTFTTSLWTGPGARTPVLSRSSGNCLDAPAGFPANITTAGAYSPNLVSAMNEYRKCNISWTPAASSPAGTTGADDGKKYSFTLNVFDNPLVGGVRIGGRYPSGDNSLGIPSNNLPSQLGTSVPYSFTVEVLEKNINPIFYDSTYSTKISTSFPPTNVVSPVLASYPTPVPGSGAYDCTNTDAAGVVTNCPETLQSATAIDMNEGEGKTFTVSVKSAQQTAAFRTFTPIKPSFVRVLNNNGTISNYSPPSFGAMTITKSSENISNGTMTATFSWSPTDAEAYALSTLNGFLIPVDVTNQAYDPAPQDGTFPNSFRTPALKSRIWMWAKVKVTNTAPVVQIMNLNGTNPVGLQNNKLTITAGAVASFRIQIQKTKDIAARLDGALTDRFQPTLPSGGDPQVIDALKFSTLNYNIISADAGTGYVGCTKATANVANITPTNTVISSVYKDDYPITFCPDYTEAGKMYTLTLQITEPGDISKGLAYYPDPQLDPTPSPTPLPPKTCSSSAIASNNCRSMIGDTVASKTISIPFVISIVGAPQFAVPKPVPSPSPATFPTAYAYVNQSFAYPMSLNITRPNERRQTFFIGIDQAAAIAAGIPLRTTASGTTSLGFYVNENFVLKWPSVTSTVAFPLNTTKTIPFYGVLGKPGVTYCQASTYSVNVGAGDKTLIRYNETTGAPEICKVKGADINVNSGSSSLNVYLAQTAPSIPSIASVKVSRPYGMVQPIPASSPALVQNEVNQQFADFKGRCQLCSNAPSTQNGSVNALTFTYSGTPSVGTPSFAAYTSSNGQESRFSFDGTSITKSYLSTSIPSSLSPAATPAQNTLFSATEGETLTFSATLSSTPPSTGPFVQYRWYMNGCLYDAGALDSTKLTGGNTIVSKVSLTSLMSARNDDCSGRYGISEAQADSLGKVVVRLTLGNGNEALSTVAGSVYDGSSSGYVWVANILNMDPFINTDPNPTPSPNMAAPIKLSGSDYLGTSPSSFILPVTYLGKEFFAYTDDDASTYTRIRLKQIDSHGDIGTTTPASMVVNCQESSSVKLNSSGDLKWFGVNPDPNGKLAVIASKDDTYTVANYINNKQSCFSKDTLSLTTTTATEMVTAAKGTSTIAAYMAYSKFRSTAFPTATFTTTSDVFNNGVNTNSFFHISRSNGKSDFWDGALTSYPMFASPIPELANFSGNSIRKTIVSGTKSFFLIGTSNNSTASTRGFIVYENLTNSGKLVSVVTPMPTTYSIAFNDGSDGSTVNASDCNFNGTPVDGVYNDLSDTFFAQVSGYDNVGRIVAIKNISSNPTCSVLNKTIKMNNPLTNMSVHNPSLIKMVMDPSHGLIYGITTPQSTSYSGQFYVVDMYSERIVTRDIPAAITPYELVFSQNYNALYLYDNRRSGTTVYPMLYRIW